MMLYLKNKADRRKNLFNDTVLGCFVFTSALWCFDVDIDFFLNIFFSKTCILHIYCMVL